jgi:hypothetical protein
LRTISDKILHRLPWRYIVDNIVAFDSGAGYYLSFLNLNLWYYHHRHLLPGYIRAHYTK